MNDQISSIRSRRRHAPDDTARLDDARETHGPDCFQALDHWLTDLVAEAVFRALCRWSALAGHAEVPIDAFVDSELDVLTAGQVAKFLNMPKRRIYELAKRGELPSVRIGRHVRFRRRGIETWLIQREALGRDSSGMQTNPGGSVS
jgi:excisionase family DNA binding protein